MVEIPGGTYEQPAYWRSDGAGGWLDDVWEWTSSEFSGYSGSEAFFDDGYRMLRGGSWATRRGPALRLSFRNWDLPIRRQIFSGFRCAETIEGR